MNIRISILFFFLTSFSFAQVAPDKYFIEFTDKSGSPYSIDRPQEFLSQRAIERRNNQGIEITVQDLPVNPSYIQGIRNLGVIILNPTKWLNGMTILANDTSVFNELRALPYVKSISVKRFFESYSPIPDKFLSESVYPAAYFQKNTTEGYNYGPSFNQIHMLNGDVLHSNGFRGQGKIIAVLDAGFQNADVLIVFDSLRNENRLLGTKDFVNPGGNVFQLESAHGTMVLSTMAGNIPGGIIGTAPKASYWLLRAEDAATENFIEEYNWVTAAEFADSLGADVINSSLGYTSFFDPYWDHTCADMNGNTTPVTIGANIAASKGIAIINSAGNSGGSGWTCVGAPSDGDLVTAVAAVDAYGNYAFFSSVGVDTAGRVKPNVAAQGYLTWVVGGGGALLQSNGTSFSSPVIAGMVACLWQSHPERTRTEIIDFMQRSASQFENPDSLLGYGIPDFSKAMMLLSSGVSGEISKTAVYPNPFDLGFVLTYNNPGKASDENAILYDITGRIAGEWRVHIDSGNNVISVHTPASLAKGVYILSVAGESIRVIKR